MGSEACALKGCPSSYAIELRLFLCRYRDIERNNRVRQSSATIERSDDAKAIQAIWSAYEEKLFRLAFDGVKNDTVEVRDL